MTEKKQDTNALARLDLRKPEDIVREERARLEALVAKDPPQWWKDYSVLYYDRIKEPSPFPTLLLGMANILALGWFAATFFGPWPIPGAFTLVSLFTLAFTAGGIGLVRTGYDRGPRGWMALRNFFFPVGFFLTLKEWRAWKNLPDWNFRCQEIDDARYGLARFSPARAVREHYTKAVAVLRRDVLGNGSKMELAKKSLATQLGEAQKILAELEKRILGATESRERMNLLKQGIARAKERVAKLEAILERQNLAIKKATEFLDRCQTLAEGMDGAIGDLELLRKLDAGIEEDHSVIQKAEEAVEEMVKELYVRMVGLQAAASAVHLPAPSSDEVIATALPIEGEFAEYERLAEQVLALDVDSLTREKPTSP